MIGLMFAAALMDTVCVPEQEFTSVFVHEWGVVSLSESALEISSAPGAEESEFYDPGSMDDRAPVVYFHGCDFHDATFTVTLERGTFTDIYPAGYEMLEGNAVSWEIERGYRAVDDYVIPYSMLPSMEPLCDWPIEEWRNSISLVLQIGEAYERFLYYECSIPCDRTDPPFPFSRVGIDPEYGGEVLMLWQDDQGRMMMVRSPEADHAWSSSGSIPYSRETVLDILCEWSAGDLKSDEIIDLWDTWEGYVTGPGWQADRLLMFRLPESTVESLTGIHLETAEGFDVTYSRFYLGLVPFSWLI